MIQPPTPTWLISILPAVAALVLLVSAPCRADEYDQFTIAKNAFDAGEYQEAVKRFDDLLKRGLSNPSLIIETHKLIAVSYLFTGNEAAAEDHFTKLLTRAPDFNLDPLLYPIEVIDFFTEIKQKSKKQLEALAKAKAIEEANRKAREEARRKEEAEKLKRNVYIERKVQKGSLLVAVLPFGAGQFQNGDRVKGMLFFSSELVLTASAVTFYFLHAGLRNDAGPVSDPDRLQSLEMREKVYRIGNYAAIGTLAAVGVAGLLDSLLRFQGERIFWKKVDEETVPDRYKQRPSSDSSTKLSVSLQSGSSLFGVSLRGRF